VYSSTLEQDLLAGHREHGNVPSGTIKTEGGHFLTGARLLVPQKGLFFMRRTREVLREYGKSVWY
jgi:hypothetical protein